MSNIAPQTPFLNRVLWEHLESHVRNVIRNEHKKAFVIDGPIYGKVMRHLGPDRDIAVPTHYFKVVYFLDPEKKLTDLNLRTPALAVIMPNVDADGKEPQIGDGSRPCPQYMAPKEDMEDWKKYQVSLEQVETKSGLHITF